MFKHLIIPLIFIFYLNTIIPVQSADRITLLHGDIFIGSEEEFKDGRFLHERFGFHTRTPYWFIKKIEKDVSVFDLTSVKNGNFTTDTVKVFGDRILPVTSEEPMETSNLELHPWRSDHWIAAERYLRGYIVNRSNVGYEVLRASVVFYGLDRPGNPTQPPGKIRLMEEQITVFKLYPMTMKPFLMEAWMVPWDQVESIRILPTSEVRMIRAHTEY